MDVKTPGARFAADAKTYLVGTAQVQITGGTAGYSEWPVLSPTFGWPVFDLRSTQLTRQVAIVQCRDAEQAIVWQRFFYGFTENEHRYTNARAIAVWEDPNPLLARVAICGETCEQQLPLSQLSTPLSSATDVDPTGFVAVFNGEGTLLWSFQVHGADWEQHCAITDLFVHVETVGEVSYDVVTYCGLSTHGVPSSATPLSPLRAFTGVPNIAQSGYTYVPAQGDTHNGAGQTDGIVGRLRHNRTSGLTTRDFHAIVGGGAEDALYGLAAFSATRFVTSGETKRAEVQNPGNLAVACPFTDPNYIPQVIQDWNGLNHYAVGTLHAFDVFMVDGDPYLALLYGHPIGRPGEEWQTIALDVAVARAADGETTNAKVHVVGVTNDWTNASNNLFASSLPFLQGQLAEGYHGGLSDGFLLSGLSNLGASSNVVLTLWEHGSYWGDADEDYLTGVSVWNEWPDTVYGAGMQTFVDTNPSSYDPPISSSFIGTRNLAVARFTAGQLVRGDWVGSTSYEFPAALGDLHAGGPFTGGGISVDMRGRAHVVGLSAGSSASIPFPDLGGLPGLGSHDGLHVIYELLPQGVWRTDGTGTRNEASFGPVPQPDGYDGGTTPAACISALGRRIGESQPHVNRMLMDYWGPAPAAGETGGLLLLEPNFDIMVNSQFTLAVLDIGILDFPTLPSFASLEIWMGTNPTTLMLYAWSGTPPAGYPAFQTRSLAWPMWNVSPGMPGAPMEFAAQVFLLLPTTLPCDNSATLAMAASPAIIFSY